MWDFTVSIKITILNSAGLVHNKYKKYKIIIIYSFLLTVHCVLYHHTSLQQSARQECRVCGVPGKHDIHRPETQHNTKKKLFACENKRN